MRCRAAALPRSCRRRRRRRPVSTRASELCARVKVEILAFGTSRGLSERWLSSLFHFLLNSFNFVSQLRLGAKLAPHSVMLTELSILTAPARAFLEEPPIYP